VGSPRLYELREPHAIIEECVRLLRNTADSVEEMRTETDPERLDFILGCEVLSLDGTVRALSAAHRALIKGKKVIDPY
jgi:hypothetical protein